MKQILKRYLGIVAMAFSLNILFGMNAIAAGDSMSTADVISLGTVKNDSLSGQYAYHKFIVSDTGKYLISGTTNISSDVTLSLLNPNGSEITYQKPTWNNQSSSGIWSYSRWLSQGTYYLRIYEWNDKGAYSISVRKTESANETFPSTYGMKENTGTADIISLGSTINGALTTENNTDYYKFTVSDSGKYQISGTTSISSDVTLSLLNPNGNGITYQKPTWNNQSSSGIWSYSRWLSQGTYYLSVYDYSNRGRYSISVNEVESAHESFPSTYGMKENTGTANAISLGSISYGVLTTENDTDYYKFTVSDSGKYLISGTTNISPDAQLYLLKSDGNTITSQKPTWNSQISSGTWSYIEELSIGTYYLRVYDYSNRGAYSISVNKYSDSIINSESIDASLKKTSIKKLNGKNKSVKVQWKKISSGIAGYEIQYSTDKRFSVNKTKSKIIKKSKTTSKEIKKLKRNTKYYIRIRTYKKDGSKTIYSNWSKIKSVRTK